MSFSNTHEQLPEVKSITSRELVEVLLKPTHTLVNSKDAGVFGNVLVSTQVEQSGQALIKSIGGGPPEEFSRKIKEFPIRSKTPTQGIFFSTLKEIDKVEFSIEINPGLE